MLALRNAPSDLVKILDCDDPALIVYREQRYQLPLENLRHYLAVNQDRDVTYEHDGEIVVIDSSRTGDRTPLVPHKLFRIQALDEQRPVRCQM